jgi:hypothetical protein
MIRLDSDLPLTPSALFRCIDDTPASPASRSVLTKPIASTVFDLDYLPRSACLLGHEAIALLGMISL